MVGVKGIIALRCVRGKHGSKVLLNRVLSQARHGQAGASRQRVESAAIFRGQAKIESCLLGVVSWSA